MLQAALASGEAHRSASSRRSPGACRTVGALRRRRRDGTVLEALEQFRFGDAELRFLSDPHVVNQETLEWLAAYRFSGTITGYPEGEFYFPYSRARRRVDLRRGGRPRDPDPVDPQPRHGHRLGRVPMTTCGRWPAASRWGRAAPTRRPPSLRRGRPTSPASTRRATWRQGGVRRADRRHGRTPSRSSTTPSATRSPPRSSRSARARRSSSTPTT